MEKKFDDVSAELKNLISVASGYGKEILFEHIETAIKSANEERATLEKKLNDALQNADEATSSSEAESLVRRQRKALALARKLATDISDKIEALEYEIADADQFIDHLRGAITDFDDAAKTFFALGAVRFEFCPSCFTSIAPHEHDGISCHLCGAETDTVRDDTRALAVKLDLQMQINESVQLQDERERSLAKLKQQQRAANSGLRSAISASELGRRSAASKFETVISETSRQLGYLQREIEQLQQREALAKQIATLSEEKSVLNARISEIKDRIQSNEAVQLRRKQVAYTAISENMKKLLSQDLAEHSDFGDVKSITFSFSGDWIAINGDKNRVGSASGMVVLKNSFLLSLFTASLFDREFNLPRFMLMDNIEDKGMVQERSWNFQRLIVKASEAARVPNQIIFSTSKIAPELADTPLVVGSKYTKANHTLRIRSR